MGGHQGVPNRSHLWAAPRCDTKGSVGETKRQRPLRRGAHCATPLFSDVAQRLCRPHERSTVDDTVVATTATPERGRPTANGGGRAACRGVAQRADRRRAQAARPRARQLDFDRRPAHLRDALPRRRNACAIIAHCPSGPAAHRRDALPRRRNACVVIATCTSGPAARIHGHLRTRATHRQRQWSSGMQGRSPTHHPTSSASSLATSAAV